MTHKHEPKGELVANVAVKSNDLIVDDNQPQPQQQRQQQQQPRLESRFGRNLSTPSRIRPICIHQLTQQEDENVKNTHSSCCGCLRRYHRYRHSTCERTCHQQQIHQANCAHKSTSTTSSSASDSAFSQSQTTLESDSEQLTANCFRRVSLKSDQSFKHATEEAHQDGGPDNNDSSLLSLVNEDDHFQIIWRDLSYRVPEKRFARFRAFVKRRKDKLWSNNEGDVPTAEVGYDPEIATNGNCQQSQGSNRNHEGPSLRSPTTGKPRSIIFSKLNGCVKSGQLTAILGPSGAGKTTFLKCLTNSITEGVSGNIDIIGGNPITSHQLKLCIIPQKDYLFDNLTVMENLVFASRIKNTNGNFDHKSNVERVANLLGLQSCLKLKTSRLSGGQYKRVSIAQELLSKPDILILDEPTSGLDSLTCFRTVSVLSDLVRMSRTGLMPPLAIVMTIHQPQIKIFNLFHHVYILSSMGQCVYEGKPEYLIDTVAESCKLLPPPDDLNPASFIIDLASEVYGTEAIDQLVSLQRKNSQMIHAELFNQKKDRDLMVKSNSLSLFVDQQDIYPNSMPDIVNNKHNLKEEPDLHDDGRLFISDRLRKRNNQGDSFWLHTALLVKRLWISMWRDPLLTTTRITFHLIIPFVFYFVYSQKSGSANACPYVERELDLQTITSEANVQRLATQHNELILTFENVSLFFLLLYSFSMCVLAVTALSFPLNMQILLKETSNGWYSMPRFVMAKTIADLPMELTMPMISVSIAYMLTGQPGSYLCWRMLTVTAVMTLCSLISQTQGLLFGAYFMNNVQAAVFVSQAFSLPWIMLSGFTTRVSELPTILQWLSFGSIYRLGIESIVAIRYGFGMCPCDQELVNDTPTKIVGIPDQVRSVMRYYLDMYSNDTTTNSTEDIFERVASTISRANTYGVDIVSCHDVRPFIMSAREVDEGTLPSFLLILALIYIGLKVLLFCVVRLRAG